MAVITVFVIILVYKLVRIGWRVIESMEDSLNDELIFPAWNVGSKQSRRQENKNLTIMSHTN